MFSLIGGLLSGGASLLGSYFSSQTSAQNTQAQIAGQERMQKEAEDFNASQAQQTRDFQAQMSNTAYQRASADMKAAGLNPAMMFSSGSAAGTPSGATGSISTPTMPTPQRTSALAGLGDAVGKTVNSAIAVKQFEKMTDEIANLKAEHERINAVTEAEKRKPLNVDADTALKWSESGRTAAQQDAIKQDMIIRGLDKDRVDAIMALPPEYRKALFKAEFSGEKINNAAGPAWSAINAYTRKFGLDLLAEKMRKGSTGVEKIERYDPRGNYQGSTKRSFENWPVNP